MGWARVGRVRSGDLEQTEDGGPALLVVCLLLLLLLLLLCLYMTDETQKTSVRWQSALQCGVHNQKVNQNKTRNWRLLGCWMRLKFSPLLPPF